MPEAQAAIASPADAGLKAILLLAYGLFLLAPFNGITAVAGAILLYVKRSEARGTLWEGHVRNLIHLFWITLVTLTVVFAVILVGAGRVIFTLFETNGHPPMELVGAMLVLAPALYIGGLAFAIWYLYRSVRGLIRALESRPYA
jgi:uncharacterized membrane protein